MSLLRFLVELVRGAWLLMLAVWDAQPEAGEP